MPGYYVKGSCSDAEIGQNLVITAKRPDCPSPRYHREVTYRRFPPIGDIKKSKGRSEENTDRAAQMSSDCMCLTTAAVLHMKTDHWRKFHRLTLPLGRESSGRSKTGAIEADTVLPSQQT
jgi:hypothetical protein